MTTLRTIFAALLISATPAQAQTLKSLMYNTTNGQVVANTGTNVLTFTNSTIRLFFNGDFLNIAAAEIYSPTFGGEIDFEEKRFTTGNANPWNFDGSGIENAGVIKFVNLTSAAATRTNLGLGATNNVDFGSVSVSGSFVANVAAVEIDKPLSISDRATTNAVFEFEIASDSGIARTNLGATTIGNAVYTAANATAARQALGLQSYTNTLTNSVGTVEIGSTVSNVTVGWTIAPTNATYSVRTLVGVGQTNSITNNSSTLALTNLALTSNTTWTLTVGDGLGVTNTATTTVSFLNYMIWGRSTNATLSNSNIQTLHTNGGGSDRAFSTSRARSFSMDGGGQYLYIAYPASFGNAIAGGVTNAMIVDGNVFNNFVVTTNTFTNAQNVTNSYLIYRTANIINGSGVAFTVQ